MSHSALEDSSTPRDFDWRVLLALVITAFWLGSGAFYIGINIGWPAFFELPLDSLGSFLEGAFAPLAFLWLVVGYFLQQKELAKNTRVIQRQHEELRKSAELAEEQTKALQADAKHSQQRTFMRIHAAMRESLGGLIGMLYISSQSLTSSGRMDTAAMAQLWSRMTRGDPEYFAREFLQLNAAGDEDMRDLFFGTAIRQRHSTRFVKQFERLVDAAKACDPEGLIVNSVQDTALGMLCALIVRYRDELPVVV